MKNNDAFLTRILCSKISLQVYETCSCPSLILRTMILSVRLCVRCLCVQYLCFREGVGGNLRSALERSANFSAALDLTLHRTDSCVAQLPAAPIPKATLMLPPFCDFIVVNPGICFFGKSVSLTVKEIEQSNIKFA